MVFAVGLIQWVTALPRQVAAGSAKPCSEIAAVRIFPTQQSRQPAVDQVLPRVQLRQWVLSMPKRGGATDATSPK